VYNSRSQLRPAEIPCSGSKSTNNAAKPAARSRSATRSVTARSWLLWLMNTEAMEPVNTEAMEPAPSLAHRRGHLDVRGEAARQEAARGANS
jgi:hypothetical protein